MYEQVRDHLRLRQRVLEQLRQTETQVPRADPVRPDKCRQCSYNSPRSSSATTLADRPCRQECCSHKRSNLLQVRAVQPERLHLRVRVGSLLVLLLRSPALQDPRNARSL